MINEIPWVSICCTAYNHAPYIRKCLDGFVMQQTSFPFEVLIHDDASTDCTADIIREYEKKYTNIIKPTYQKENKYSKRIDVMKTYLYPRAKGKYIALCEGDDYWIDPLKLQKQVDFLEANPEYGMIHTNFSFVDTDNMIISTPDTPLYRGLKKRIFNGYIWGHLLINPGFILTCTICFRKSLIRDDEILFFDHSLFSMIARQSKVYYLIEIMSCYRRNPQGVMMSSPRRVSSKMGLVLLYQLYYYYKNEMSSASYYHSHDFSKKNLLECYANILLRFDKVVFKEYRKLIYLVIKNPLFVLCLPYFFCVVFNRKIIKRCFCTYF